jgi:hypothetical protein
MSPTVNDCKARILDLNSLVNYVTQVWHHMTDAEHTYEDTPTISNLVAKAIPTQQFYYYYYSYY